MKKQKLIAPILAAVLAIFFIRCGSINTTSEQDAADSKSESAAENDESSPTDSQVSGELPSSNSSGQDDASELGVLTVSSAHYPEMALYPDEMLYINDNGGIDDTFWDAYEVWENDNQARRTMLEDYDGELNPFFTDSIRQFLSGSQGQNRIYSPINVYMALGMLAEVTDGESREQVLTLLGTDNIDDLRTQANTIWEANYQNDGATTSVLAGSLWLNEDVNFVQSTMDSLAENYYASSYQGVMGSDELNHALQSWLNEQTGGLLDEQASGISLDADTILALAATINFHAAWSNEFFEEATQSGVFHGVNGDIDCDFMHQDQTMYYRGAKFSAVSKYLKSDGAMWFILPDEDVSVDELLQDEQTMEFILGDKYEWENREFLTVHLSVPKFDVSSDLDLTSGLKALGVTDVFDPAISDFTPMTLDTGEIYLSQAKHAARVKIDEEGCTAAAYTVMAAVATALPPEEEIDFVLDRPFIFVITGNGELPLFVGIVNRPI